MGDALVVWCVSFFLFSFVFSSFFFSFFFDVFLLVLVAALDRPLLNSVWQGRISRILDIEDRRYNIFIEPDLLATFSLGPVPSSSVKALLRANKKRESFLQCMARYLSSSSIAPFSFPDLCVSLVGRRQYNEAEQESSEADGPIGRGGGRSH